MNHHIHSAYKLKAILVFFSLIIVSTIIAQNNIGNAQYDINDPRNPDCPCHKIQQQAENEFAESNKQDKKMNSFINNLAENNVQRNLNEPKQIEGRTGKWGSVSKPNFDFQRKQKKRLSGLHKYLFRAGNKHKIRKRVKPNYAVCYKW